MKVMACSHNNMNVSQPLGPLNISFYGNNDHIVMARQLMGLFCAHAKSLASDDGKFMMTGLGRSIVMESVMTRA